MARYGYNWQLPWRTAVRGYQEFLLKFYNQVTVLAANLQGLIQTNDSLVSNDYGQGTVKGYYINRYPLQTHVQDILNSWSLLNSTYTTATELSGSLGVTNIAPGYLFIKGNSNNGTSELIFDNGQGALIAGQTSIGTIDYAKGTYIIDESKTTIKNLTDFQIGYSTGTPVYATKSEDIAPSSSGFEINSVTIKTAGTGYTAKDVVSLSDGSTVEVTTVDEDGVPTAVTLVNSVISSSDIAGDSATVGGSGTGLVLTITSKPAVVDLMVITGAIPGTAAGIPSVSIYFTTATDKVYVGYTTSNVEILQEIYNNLKSY